MTGTRRARYRGLAKTRLEHVFSAVALNLIRLDAYWNGHPLDRTSTTALDRGEMPGRRDSGLASPQVKDARPYIWPCSTRTSHLTRLELALAA